MPSHRIRSNRVSRKRSSSAGSNASDVTLVAKESHCARCHSTFTDPEERCRIPHVFALEPLYLSGGKFTFAAECCGEAATVTQRAPDSEEYETAYLEFCFEGRHSTSASDVKYNGVNILRCKHTEDGACLRRSLLQTDGVPVFRDAVVLVEKDWQDKRAAGFWVPLVV